MPSEALKSLWAKKSVSEDGEYTWLPLLTHLYDTKLVIKMLFNLWLSDSQQKLLAINGDIDAGCQLVQFIAFLHDCGKATPAFQTKSGYDHNFDLDEALLDKLLSNGFDNLSVDMLAESRKSPHAMAGEAILDDLGVNYTITGIIGGHHGRPLDTKYEALDNEDDHTSNYLQTDRKSDEQLIWKQMHKDLLNIALEECGYDSVDDLPKLNQAQSIIIEGLLIMADWLASSEYTSYWDKSRHENIKKTMFHLVPLDVTFDDIDENARVVNAWNNWYVSDKWQPADIYHNNDNPYKTRWNFDPKPIQSMITDRIQATTDPGMIIVEAEMGIGKTEIALVAAEQLASKSDKSGLFFGLPTQATSNMMFGRVVDWLKYLSGSEDEKYIARLATGNAQFNSEYTSMTDANTISDDSDDIGGVYTNSWFTRKKGVLADFQIGTIDNLLQLALKQKHLALKHLGLSRDVVVIDEAHAYDSYMNEFLYEALKWLGVYNVPVVILSATLPIEKRNKLFESYYMGKYGSKLAKTGTIPDNFDNEQGYPLLSILDGKQVHQYHDFPVNSDKHIKVNLMGDDDRVLVNSAQNAIKNGGVAGIIVNTIKHAQDIADMIDPDIPHILLHSAFLSTDRKTIENEITRRLGKPGKNEDDANYNDKARLETDKYIVIGTQVLEQSLDIDFDVLYSEIAPIDLLLQRVGRLHRHNRNRPAGLENPVFNVFSIQPEHKYGNSEYIYPKYLLAKSEDLLTNELILPRDIPRLVNDVYSRKNDNSEYDELYKKFDKDTSIERQKANVFQIKDPRMKATIHGWLSNEHKVDSEQKALAAVRDISEGVECILLKRVNDSMQLIDGTPLSNCQDSKIAQETIRLPSAFCYPQVIDKTIDKLEEITRKNVDWSDSKWLKGSICLVLDEYDNAELNDYRLHYSQSTGLSYQKIKKEDE